MHVPSQGEEKMHVFVIAKALSLSLVCDVMRAALAKVYIKSIFMLLEN